MRIFAVLLALLGSAISWPTATARAAVPQHRWYTAVTYNMAVPFSSTQEFTGDFSPLGIGVDVRYKLRTDVSVGAAFAWQEFDVKTDEVVELDNAAFQGTQFRWTNTIPILVNAHYYVTQLSDRVQPFVGLHLGAYWLGRRVDVGVYTVDQSTWHFGMAPEIGVAFSVGRFLPVLMVRYNYAFSSADTGDQSFLNFNLGLAFN